MSNKGKTAGKTAKKKSTNRAWRTTTRKGERVLIDPAGHIYRGTAREVRDAGLMPFRRGSLAQSLRLVRLLRRKGVVDSAEYRAMCEDYRRDAIEYGTADFTMKHDVPISAEMLVLLTAGARLVAGEGETVEDYFTGLFRSELDALLDVAQDETGKREIPLTSHERAALVRIQAAG